MYPYDWHVGAALRNMYRGRGPQEEDMRYYSSPADLVISRVAAAVAEAQGALAALAAAFAAERENDAQVRLLECIDRGCCACLTVCVRACACVCVCVRGAYARRGAE